MALPDTIRPKNFGKCISLLGKMSGFVCKRRLLQMQKSEIVYPSKKDSVLPEAPFPDKLKCRVFGRKAYICGP